MFLEYTRSIFHSSSTGNRTQTKGFRVPCTHRYTIEPYHSYFTGLRLNTSTIQEALSVELLIAIQRFKMDEAWNGSILYTSRRIIYV